MTAPPLYINAHQAGIYGYDIACQNGKCKHVELRCFDEFPQTWSVVDMKRELVCLECGYQQIDIFPRWPPVGEGGRRRGTGQDLVEEYRPIWTGLQRTAFVDQRRKSRNVVRTA